LNVALDHVIICCDEGGPEAGALTGLGLTEGSSNVHLGQGTRNRRFFFENAYLELVWVDDLAEAKREPARSTRLWERWLRRREGACPFGIALRPVVPDEAAAAPFPTWAYHAPYLPAQVSLGIALSTPLRGPEFLYVPFATPPKSKGLEPLSHPLGVRELTGVRIAMPGASAARSPAADAVAALGLLETYDAPDYVMELTFDRGERGQSATPVPQLLIHW